MACHTFLLFVVPIISYVIAPRNIFFFTLPDCYTALTLETPSKNTTYSVYI